MINENNELIGQMIYVILKGTNYHDIGNKRIDLGLYYVTENYISNPKDIALFTSECCKEFLEEDVFFNDQIGAYTECLKRNNEILCSCISELQECTDELKACKNCGQKID